MIGHYLSSWPPPVDCNDGASFSDDGRYRYQLWRCWDRTLPGLGFVMLNPSTADAVKPDPTIRRCLGFARREGCGGIVVANLSPFRATYPHNLDAAIKAGAATVTAHYQMVTDAMHGASQVVVAWGALSSRRKASQPWLAQQREAIAAALFADRPGRDLLCFEPPCRDGSPGHPLMLPKGARLKTWRWKR